MNDKRKSNLGPTQLDRLLGQITDRIHSSSEENQAIHTQLHQWLHSSLDDRSTLPDSLKETLRVFDKTIIEKSLIDLLLNKDTQPAVLNTLAYCAQDYSLNVTTPSEDALALTLYYAASASLLVFYHQESLEHSLESLVESFTDLKVKPWLPSELVQHIDRACQICKKKQALNSNAAGRDPTHTEASLGQWVEGVGAQIGYYKLLRMLGEGGMGIVYLAEQEQLIRRRVALKIIKAGMDSKQILVRFEAERQALALLDHPNIAQVYDAGTAVSGRPYFVMEYVKGIPITEFCDRHTLSIEERLRLFQQVCQAVHHAHQKGIIHRDIKPSNILVSSENDQIIPKMIDFGVAKALRQPLTERTLITEESQLLGTPEYMSPEQVEFANEDIDTRSDIYSLGVLLYVLLTGVLPFDSETLREGGLENIRKVIRETDPKTPSTRLTKLGEEATAIAQNRRMEIQTLARHLRKELEWIPLKAMRKERSERYRSASEFVDDIDNYLKGIPLLAGPPSNVYRIKKFVSRNLALVTSIAAVLAVLIAGIIVSTLFAIRAGRALSQAQAVSDFLENDVLGPVSFIEAQQSSFAYLDSTAARLEGKFEDQPLVEASIRETLGWKYRNISQNKPAAEHLERAYQLFMENLGQEHPDTINCMHKLGWVYIDQFRHQEAKELLEKARSTSRRVLGDEHPRTLGFANMLGIVYNDLGRYDEAEKLYLESLPTVRRVCGEKTDLYLFLVGNLGGIYSAQGRYNEAEHQYLEMLRLCDGFWDDEGGMTLSYKNFLARVYRMQKRYEEAERLYLEILPIQRRVDGDKHWRTLRSVRGLALVYKEQERYEEAEPLLLEALEIRRLILSDTHPHTLESWNNLIDLYEAWGKPEKAEEWRAKLQQVEAIEH